MKSNSKIIILIVVILAGVGYAYFFTDFFLSSSEKFIQELEYYENLRYDTEEYRIQDYIDEEKDWAESRGYTVYVLDTIKISKQELREKVAQEGSFGGFNMEIALASIVTDEEFNPPDLSYDQTKLTLWVVAYGNEDVAIYYWSPR